MATQTITTQMVQIFHQNGLIRKLPSFFGQGLKGQPLFSQLAGVTPPMAMLRLFGAAKLTVTEANFFGLSVHGSVSHPCIVPQPNATTAHAAQTFLLPQRADQAA